MAVFHDPKRRGKQWVCQLTVNKIKSITLHYTEEEANKHYKKLKSEVENGLFIEKYKPKKLIGVTIGGCLVDEAEEGVRCERYLKCPNTSACHRDAWKYDLKGWKLHDTNQQGNA